MKKRFYIVFVLFVGLNLQLFADSPRRYVFESFTNTYSELCAEANANIYYLMDRYPDKIIPIVYHASTPNEKDYFYKNSKEIADGRIEYYSKINTFPGVPHCIIDGNRWFGIPTKLNLLKRNLDRLDSSVSPIDIDVSMTKKNSVYDVEVYVRSSENIGKKQLIVLLMEYEYTKSEVPLGGVGNSEIKFKWIARKILTSPLGDVININKNNYVHFSEDIAHEESMRYNNLYAVAFVQDSATGEILQANTNFKPFTCIIEPSNGSQYRTIDSNAYDIIKYQLTNPNDFDVDFWISSYTDNTNLTAQTDTSKISIRAGQTEVVSVNVRSNNNSVFGKVVLDVVPILTELPKYYGVKTEITYPVYYLSKNAKFATIYTSDYSISTVKNAVNSLEDYKYNWVFLPSDIYLEGYSTKLFDVLYMLVHPDNAVDYSINSKKIDIVTNHVENKKNVILSSPKSLSVLAGKYAKLGKIPAENLKTLFNKYIGVTLNSTIIRDVDSYDTTYISGIPNSIISNSLDTVGIEHNYPELSSFESISINSNSSAKPFLNYGLEIDNKIVAVYNQYNSSKIAYIGVGFEQFTSTPQIAQTLKDLMIWFDADKSSKLLEVSNVDLNFVTEVGDSSTKSFSIKNIGSKDIAIKRIYLTDYSYGFEIDTVKYINRIIKSDEVIQLVVDFIPKADYNCTSQLIIENGSTNLPEIKINLFGYGYVSVNDEKSSSLSITPNPAEDFITIKLTAGNPMKGTINPTLKHGDNEILIYNTIGEIVMSESIHPMTASHRMNIKGLPKGIYFVKAGNELVKFIKL